MDNKNVTFNISGGQVNLANENATINATQNNGVSINELDNIIQDIMENLSGLNKEETDEIIDVIEMTEEELKKTEPKVGRLKNCLNLIASLFTIANGIPELVNNLQKLYNFINMHIH